MKSSRRMTTIIPISSGRAPMPGRLEELRERDRRGRRACCVKLKKAMNWAIISSMKMRPARPANVFVTAAMTSFGALERPGAEAVADARDQEDHGDDEQQAVHERRVADDVAGDRVAERRALGGSVRSRISASTAKERDQRPAQAARLGRLVDLGSVDGAAPRSPSPVVGAEARLDDALGDERTRRAARTSDETTREPVVGDDRDRLRRRRCRPSASLVTSVIIASIGPGIGLTPKMAADAREAGGHARPAGAVRR